MSGGFFSSLKKEAEKLGRDVSRGMDSLAKDVNKAVDERWSSPILDAFTNGNVIQLISRSSGKSLQIVQSAAGQLVVDGLGLEGPTAYNAHWRIINHGKNIISLQNQNNFIALQNGIIYIVNIPPGTPAGVETLFRLSQIDKNFVMLISKKEDNARIGVLKDGQMKSPLATVTEWDAQFGIRVISTQITPVPIVRGRKGTQRTPDQNTSNRASKVPQGATNIPQRPTTTPHGATTLPHGNSAIPQGAYAPQGSTTLPPSAAALNVAQGSTAGPRGAAGLPSGSATSPGGSAQNRAGIAGMTAASAKEIEALGPRRDANSLESDFHDLQNNQNAINELNETRNTQSESRNRQAPQRPPPPYVVAAGSTVTPYPPQGGTLECPPPYPGGLPPEQYRPDLLPNTSYHSVPGNPAYPDVQ